VHIRQKHSADIVFLELIKIINWFNPLIYLLQMSLKTMHEYIADEQTAAQESDAISYSSFLVNNAYGLNGSSLAHSFFNYNLLKKRIIMLNQKRSGN
jgi:beta-lactamase regulating signal transducer with metallopeptidase domain